MDEHFGFRLPEEGNNNLNLNASTSLEDELYETSFLSDGFLDLAKIEPITESSDEATPLCEPEEETIDNIEQRPNIQYENINRFTSMFLEKGMIKLEFETRFLAKYWRNDRKNIQCFPFCPEYGDYLNMRKNKGEHRGSGACSSPVCLQVTGHFDSKETMFLSRICFAYDSFDLKPGDSFSLDNFKKIESCFWKGNLCPSLSASGNEQKLRFIQTKWKMYKTMCGTRRPLNLQKSTKYAFEVLALKIINGGRSMVIGYTISSPFQIASTRDLFKEIHPSKTETPKRKAENLESISAKKKGKVE